MFLSCMCLRFWLDVESDSGKVGFSLWVWSKFVKGWLALFRRARRVCIFELYVLEILVGC